MTTPVDLVKLRALMERSIKLGKPSQRHHAGSAAALQEWINAIDDAAPALFDDLEAAREEVARLRATQEHTGYVATHSLVRQAYSDERAMVVAWLRVNGTGHLADCIERGDHHESAQPPTATRPRYCYRCNDSGTIQWTDDSKMPCDHCRKGVPG